MTHFCNPFKLDTRSLAVFRLGLGLIFIFSLLSNTRATQTIPFPAEWLNPILFQSISNSLGIVAQQFLLGYYLLILMIVIAGMMLLVGYRTRLANLACFILGGIAYLTNIGHFGYIGIILLPLLLWSCFLPLGVSYSLDNAMNLAKSRDTQAESLVSISLVLQQCFSYWLPVSPFLLAISRAGISGNSTIFQESLLMTATISPLFLLIPIGVTSWRLFLLVLFAGIHWIAISLFAQPLLVGLLAIVTWFAFLPQPCWTALEALTSSTKSERLTVYYDADCGFCKKVVHVLRTFVILPKTVLLTAQSDPSIHKDMEAYNSWVVTDGQECRHYKFEAIAYICSLSPLFKYFAPLLRLSPVMTLGTRFYEMVANNRKRAGLLTRPLKFRTVYTTITKAEEFGVLVISITYFSINLQLTFNYLKASL